MKLKTTEIAGYRETLRKQQRDKCPICGCKLSLNLPSLDHDHETGDCRGVLCRNCNQVEGRILAWVRRGARGMDTVRFLENLLRYLRKHRANPSGVEHPTHGKPRKRRRRRKRAKAAR